jgi:hypothetical protein
MMRRILPALLFTLAAIASFSVWAFGSGLYQSEIGLYSLCAIVFLGFGGLALTPGQEPSGWRYRFLFAARFAAGFAAYAMIWSITWFTFRNSFGEILGSFFGYLALVSILRPAAVREGRGLTNTTAVVFLWATLGYYAGEFAHEALQNRGSVPVELPLSPGGRATLARLGWGLFYGLGLGYGLASVTQPRR